jgi:hypothetical protein
MLRAWHEKCPSTHCGLRGRTHPFLPRVSWFRRENIELDPVTRARPSESSRLSGGQRVSDSLGSRKADSTVQVKTLLLFARTPKALKLVTTRLRGQRLFDQHRHVLSTCGGFRTRAWRPTLGNFECISRRRSAWCRNAELSDRADSETPRTLPHRDYVLHRTGCSQKDDQLLREG